jgi:hypothetical protein
MDLSWLTPEHPLATILLGGAGNLLGNVVEKRGAELIEALSGRLRSRFQPALPRTAVRAALAYALVETILLVSREVEEFAQLLHRFDRWLAQEEAIFEFSEYLLAPAQGSALDLETLEAAFAQAGFDPQHLGGDLTFAEVVATLTEQFCRAAAAQPALQGVLEIDLLRQAVAQLRQVAQSGKAQVGLLERIAQTLEGFQPLELGAVERAYLRRLYEQCNDLPLARDDRADPGKGGARLQRVYVELQLDAEPSTGQLLNRLGITTKRQRQHAAQLLQGVGQRGAADRADALETSGAPILRTLPADELQKLATALKIEVDLLRNVLGKLSPLEALQAQPQIVILGDPGSGKSTLTQRLAALLAVAGCDDPALRRDLGEQEVDDLQQLLKHMGRRLLPVRIVLTRWAQQLAASGHSASPGNANDLINECVRLLGEVANLGERQRERFVARLTGDEPPTALLLLDGLDEVSDEGRRQRLVEAVRDFHSSYPQVPLIVTCRVRPYESWRKAGQSLPLGDFVLAPLTTQAIAHFIQRWYSELLRVGLYSVEHVQRAQDRLAAALRDPQRGELDKMAAIPLLLTMMARVNYHNPLPEGRAELYELFINQLFYEWEKLKQDDPTAPTRLETLLSEAGVTKGSLEQALNHLAWQVHDQAHGDTVDIARNQLRDLLEEIHPGRAEEKAAWATQLLRLIADRSGLINAVDATPGREIYKFSHRTFQEYLAARRLASGPGFVRRFAEKIDLESWREAILLAIGYQVFVQKPPAYDSVLDLLDELLMRRLPASPSDAVGWRRFLLLAGAYVHLLTAQRAGEADQEARAAWLIRELPAQLLSTMQRRDLPPRIRLEGGLLLADLGFDPPGLDNFLPTPESDLRMGQYPVTNKQFRRFVEAQGYATPAWWSERGWEYKEELGWSAPRFWDDPDFKGETRPVVGVSWYEAAAYCNWLSQQGGYGLQAHEIARLPTQAEWLSAARNGQPAPSDATLDYPWNGPFEIWRANANASKLEQTTPVHMHPGGLSAGGLWDLCGNVWEWTSDQESRDWYFIKGGSWSESPERCRQAASRSWLSRHLWPGNVGFRVCAVPRSR